MDVLARLHELQELHGWSSYKIAKEAGLAANTVANIYKRNTLPSLMTLEALCKAFGISLSQFFCSDEETTELTPELRELVAHWSVLSPGQKETVWQVIKSYGKK